MKSRSLLMIPGMVFVLMGCSVIDPGPGGPFDPEPVTDPATDPEPVPEIFSAPLIHILTDNADGYADFEAEIILSNKDATASNEWSTNDGIDWQSGDTLTVYSATEIQARSLATNGEISPLATDTVQFYKAPVYDFQWGLSSSLANPYGIATQNGEIYVAEGSADCIQVFDTNGQLIREWGSEGTGEGELDQPHGICISKGLIYVADYYNSRIQVFDLQGNFIKKWGSYGTENDEFIYPYDVFAIDNEVYVTDFMNSRVQVFDTNGTYIRQWGGYGNTDGNFYYMTGVYVYNDKVYLGDRLNNRIQVFDKWGNHLSNITGFNGPLDIIFHHDRMYVSQYGDSISVNSPEDTPLTAWGIPGIEAGQFSFPASFCFANNGVYVTDTQNKRIQKYTFQ